MYLPTPPSYREKRAYLDPNKTFLYVFGVSSYLCLLAGMALFTSKFIWFLPFLALTAVYLTISYFIGVFGTSFNYLKHRVSRWKNRKYEPTVDIYLPCCGEPIEVLLNTYSHVRNLDWPSSKLKVYVLDDGGSDEVKAHAEANGFTYIRRPNRGELKKAGNLRYAFAQTSGDLIVIYDADFVPRADFVREVAHYFADDSVAIVQTPQFFTIESSQAWIEKGASYIQELFYRLIQVNRNTWGASVCVGTNATYRRKALEPFGGTAPIGYSEDLHTGFQVITAGWKLKYIPLNLAKGICPDKLSGFFTQQYRWCMGSTTLFFNPEFWKSNLSFMAKVNYMSGMLYYMSTGIGIFLVPIPGLVMVWVFPEHVFWYNWMFSFPSMLYGIVYLSLWTRAPFGWYSFRARVASYYAHIFALYDKFRSSTMPWVPTGVAKKNSRYLAFKSLLFWWSSACFFLATAGCFYHMTSLTDFNFYPMLFFTGFNYWIQMGILQEEA